MKKKWALGAALLLAALNAGCSVPSLPSGTLRCNPDGGCADDFVCVGGLCYAPGALPPTSTGSGSASASTGTSGSTSGSGATTQGTTGGASSGASSGTGSSSGASSGGACPAPTLDVYVSADGGDNTHDGSAQHAWATLAYADQHAPAGATIHVGPGVYGFTTTTRPNLRFVSDVPWGAKVASTVLDNAAWQSSGDHVDIQGFDITGPGPYGLYLGGSHSRAIHNFIHDLPSPGTCPIQQGGGVFIQNGAVGAEALGNVIFNIGDPAQGCPNWAGIYDCGTGGLLANNLVFRSTGFGLTACASAADVTLANNTVFANASGGIQIVGLPASGGGMRVLNNIVYQNGAGLDAGGIVDPAHGGSADQFTDNLVSGNVPQDLAIAPGNLEQGGQSGSPQFVRYTGDWSGDYHLGVGSPALGTGTAAGAPAEDFDGAPRPGPGGYDLGIYQTGTVAPGWPYCPNE